MAGNGNGSGHEKLLENVHNNMHDIDNLSLTFDLYEDSPSRSDSLGHTLLSPERVDSLASGHIQY